MTNLSFLVVFLTGQRFSDWITIQLPCVTCQINTPPCRVIRPRAQVHECGYDQRWAKDVWARLRKGCNIYICF